MAVRKTKTTAKKAPVKVIPAKKTPTAPISRKPVAAVVPIDEAPKPRPTAAAVDSLARRVMALRQNSDIVKKVDGFGKPAAPASRVAEYKITFEDGSVLYAGPERGHADVIARFIEECQNTCLGQGLAYYDGPPMRRFTKEQWEARQ